MVKSCCIPICPNSKTDRGVDCYPFPSANAELRAKWISFVGADVGKFRWKTKYICAEHFHQLDLVETGDGDGKRQPAEGAVPIVYSPDDDEDDELMERDGVMVSEPTAEQPPETKPIEMQPFKETAELRLLFCRICLRKGNGLIPLNSKLHNESLLDIIYTITGLVIENEEDLPTKVCGSCVEKLDLAFNVRVEFLHYEEILRNLIQNQQLKAHYLSYDHHQNESRSWNGRYLNNLMGKVKQDVTTDQPGEPLDIEIEAMDPIKIEPIVETSYYDEGQEDMEEEHLFDEEELDGAEGTSLEDSNKPPTKKKSTTKHVFSWKELCKPKRTQQPKEYKIKEDLPEPELVPNTCYVCNTIYEDADTLENHMEEHVNLVPFTCEQCSTEKAPKVLKSLVTLNKHLQSHVFAYQCDFCPLRYPNRPAYMRHMRFFHEDKDKDGYTCQECGQHFTQKNTFSNHLYKHKALKTGKYKCEHCGKAFTGPALLRRHLRIHTGEKPFECKKCGKRFNHESIFQVHKRTHIGEKAHLCSECGKKFMIATDMRRHMAEHFPDDPQYRTTKADSWVRADDVVTPRTKPEGPCTRKPSTSGGPKERVCEIDNCGYTTKSAANWHYHNATHTMKFQCDVCARRFPTKQTLIKHVETAHEGKAAVKNRPCPHCGKLFSSNQKLRDHVDIHENNRRYKCQYCEKSFVQLTNRIAHERIHTGERPYVCRACPSAFITSSGRKKHEKKHPELED